MTSTGEADIARLVKEEVNRSTDFHLPPVPQIELAVQELNIWAQTAEGKPCRKRVVHKLILNSVACTFEAGTATAILGSSGSGKTTLLNYISSRMEDGVLKSNGSLYINGNSVSSIRPIKRRTGYVTQFDVVYAELTPREQLLYSAKLAGVDNPENKVDNIIQALGLESCANTWVGNDLQRGISGGERKRTAVGIELITDPSLLFMDEPTTGLDSKSALDIAFMIKKLAQNGRTIVSTIHSPSAEILEQFDKVVCLCKGEIVYYGPPSKLSSHFADVGFPAPPLTNPADHLMAIIHEDDIRIQALKEGKEVADEEVKTLFKKRIDHFVTTCRSSSIVAQPVTDQPEPFARVKEERITNTNAVKNFLLVLQRCLILYFRNPQQLQVKIIQHLGFAAFAIILLHNTISPETNTLQAIMDRGGMAFNLGPTMCFAGVFANLYTFIPALPVFKRESQNKLYGPLTFYLTHSLFEVPFQILLTLLYQVIVFWVVNIRQDDTAWVFFRYFFILHVTKVAAAGLGDLLSLLLRNVELVNTTFPMTVVPLLLLGGFSANIKSIPWHMKIYSYLSFFRFSFQGIIDIEFEEEITQKWIANCRLQKQYCYDKSDPNCYTNYKDFPTMQRPPACDARSIFDFYESKYGYNLLILMGQAVFFRLLALWVAYSLVRENNVVQDAIPESLRPAIDSRRQLATTRSSSPPPQTRGPEDLVPLKSAGPAAFMPQPFVRGPARVGDASARGLLQTSPDDGVD